MTIRNMALVLGLFVSACAPQLPMTEDYEKMDIVHPVKKIRIEASRREYDHTISFRSNGRIENIVYKDKNGNTVVTHKYIYKDGYLFTKQEINSNGDIDARHLYEYDESGKLICHRVYGVNNQDTDRWDFVYDGERESEISYLMEDDLQYRSLLRYDGNTRIETALSPDGDTLGTARTLFFDKDRVAAVQSEDISFSIDYNDNGIPVHTVNTVLDSERKIVWDESLETEPERWYRYEFDRKGNWIVRKEYCHPDDSIEVAIVKRLLKY